MAETAKQFALRAAQAQGSLRALRAAERGIAVCATLEEARAYIAALVDGAAIRSQAADRAAEDAVFDAAADTLVGLAGVRCG